MFVLNLQRSYCQKKCTTTTSKHIIKIPKVPHIIIKEVKALELHPKHQISILILIS